MRLSSCQPHAQARAQGGVSTLHGPRHTRAADGRPCDAREAQAMDTRGGMGMCMLECGEAKVTERTV